MRKIKKGDEVIITTGKDKGKRGAVLKVTTDMPLHISNIALFNPATGKGDRVGIKILKDGNKVRFFKSDNEVVDI